MLKNPWIQITLAGIAAIISVGSFLYSLFIPIFSPYGIVESLLVDGGVMFLSVAVLIDGISKLPKREKRIKML